MKPRTSLSRSLRRALLAALTVACLAASEHHGQVKFAGLPVPGATVTATKGDQKLVAVTDPQGVYSFADLADGIWNIQVDMLTFAPLTKEVAIAPGAPSPEWELKMMALGEIKADIKPPEPAAPKPAATETAAVAAAPPGKTNGAAPAKNGKGAKNQPPAASPQNGFQRADVNASPGAAAPAATAPADSTSVADASQGASDAFVVNGSVSTGVEKRTIGNARKGPGMMYRGDIVAVLENSALNARPFSLTGQDTPRSPYNHLRFGGSFGGPIYIPHLLRPNGQFFLNYQSTRNRNAPTQTTLMPTVLERGGDFTQTLNRLGHPVVVIDPSTGNPFPGNVIPANMISAQAKPLLNFYPLPNFPQGNGYNYQVPLVGRGDQDDMMTRINRNLGRRDFINGSFAYRNARSTSPNVFGFVDDTDLTGMQLSANWRHVFNQRWNVNLGYQFSRLSTRTTPFFANRENVSAEAGITGNNQDPVNWGPPSLSFSSVAGLSDAPYSSNHNQTSAFSGTALWIHRPHNITFGADYRRLQFNNISQQNARGSFGFTGAATQALVNGVPVPDTGYDFAGFLLGIPDTGSLAFGNADKYFRSSNADAYLSDDWRAGPGLSFNLGVRWEYGSPVTEKYGRLVNLDVTPGFRAVAPVLASSPTGGLTGQKYPNSLVQPDRHAFQPRISLAWHPIFGSSMLVRASYGVYYNTSVYQTIASRMAQQSPLSKTLNVSNSLVNPFTLANAFNTPPSNTPNSFAIDPDFRVGYSQNWQVSIQRDLTEGIVGTITYLGIKGTRAAQEFLPNTYPTGATDPCPACPSGFIYETSNGNSTRHSGQLQVQRRFHNGISASMSYVYSKAIDDAALGGRGQGGPVIAQDWRNLRAERGLSPFDQRHVVTAQAQYSTGVGVRGGALMRGWRGAAFKGWTIVTQINAGSGLPETPIYAAAVHGTSCTTCIRPDYLGGDVYAGPPGYFLNSAAFAAPALGQWGTAGRNFIIGPSQFSLNGSMSRTFKDSLDVRIDSSNALNHVTFPSWNAIVTSPQFGLPAPANAMRSLQVTLRMRF